MDAQPVLVGFTLRRIFVETGGFIQVVQHQVQVAILIEVGIGGPIGTAREIEPPGCGNIVKL